MPHDVTMPQLGMAQDAGKIVSWLKSPGDKVAKGDALFEVETDKATMEVEAQANGYLTGIRAQEGDDVPVGAVIARISDSADDNADDAAAAPAAGGAADTGDDVLPEGRSVTMPQLGMAQDSGLLVAWLKSPGDAVTADDALFEVETDKSTMEIPAGANGYLAATLADAGALVPVGEAVAIISAEKPAKPVSRSGARPVAADATPGSTGSEKAGARAAEPVAKSQPSVASPASGRILVSPKARRIALEQGLDLNRLVSAGYPQPYHVRDLDTLRAMPLAVPVESATPATRDLQARIAKDGFASFADWAASAHELTDADALLAGLAGASLTAPCVVAVERMGRARHFAVPASRALSAVVPTDEDDTPDLVLRDLRGTPLRSLSMGPEAAPVLTVMNGDPGLTLTLECSTAHMDAQAAIALLTHFAGRMENPVRHLL